MAIQRNAIVAPFSVNTPLLQGNNGNGKGKSTAPISTLAPAHQKWFQQVANGVNASLQVVTTIPANSSSPGEPGQVAFGPNTLYLCVGSNTWTKFTGAPF